MELVRVALCFLTVLVLIISAVHSRTLCSRIFFQNIDEDKMPYKFLEGVFVKQNYDNDNFPVYKQEKGAWLLYLIKSDGIDSLYFGPSLTRYVAAASTLTSALTWLITGTSDRNDVFGGLISQWKYFNSRDRVNYRAPVPPYIKAICVDDDFREQLRECNSDKVYLNDNFHQNQIVVNNMNTDYFKRLTDTFNNFRPVYKHSTQNWYLQYTGDDYWVVTTTRYPSGYDDGGNLMRVKDYASRPEYINSSWSIHYSAGWFYKLDLKVKCRGVRSQANICSSSPCFSGATCIFTSGNESVCVCPPGYYGPTCANSKKCPTPTAQTTEIGFSHSGNIPGYVAITFCRSSYPSKRYAICSDSGWRSLYWSRQGSACRENLKTTQRPYWTTQWSPWNGKPTMEPRQQPINFDDIPGLDAGILTCAVLLQILLPFVLWCCACCKKSCKEVDEDEVDQQRQEEFEGQLETRLENVRRAQSQEELDQGVQEYRQTVEYYQRETEATQMKRKKGLYRNASLLRLYSMDFYISFYLWVIYMLVCRGTQCAQYGAIFAHLLIMAIVMLIICPIYVLIESIFSHELSYISNIMEDETAWGYIQKMHAVAPVISMTVECYHWETRTRVVYYTDANGNSQSRTETYQERVVTYVDEDEFAYGCWVDVSKREMPALSYVALTRLKIDPYILFGDQETEEDFDRQREEMLDRNRHRDELMDFSFSKSIPGLKKRISAYVDMTLKPWWISKGYYWLATLLVLTWPYRWLFRAKTAKTYYDMKKKMYKSTSPPPEVDIMDPIAILQQAGAAPIPGSNVNPSFAMTELPSSATAPPPYPPNKGPAYPSAMSGPAYPPNTGPPDYTAVNQGPAYPPTNQGPPYPSANQGPPYPSANQAPPYPPANQGPAYPTANQGVPQQVPNIPPPEYDAVVSQSAPTSRNPVA